MSPTGYRKCGYRSQTVDITVVIGLTPSLFTQHKHRSVVHHCVLRPTTLAATTADQLAFIVAVQILILYVFLIEQA